MTDGFTCPDPDCGHTEESPVDLSDHINDEHPGGYKKDGWPDPTPPEGDDDGSR